MRETCRAKGILGSRFVGSGMQVISITPQLCSAAACFPEKENMAARMCEGRDHQGPLNNRNKSKTCHRGLLDQIQGDTHARMI